MAARAEIGRRKRDGPQDAANAAAPDATELPAPLLRRGLMTWYRAHGRVLPWRQTIDPYRIWVSEIMLQQTRVAAVVEHYNRFVLRFPTIVALSLAPEQEVLAAWSGLGYYRRARMLHKAAQFLVLERAGVLPSSAAELRTLPGIGDYTAAAIASIAFGESVAVVDGNVERVLLRLTGRGEQPGMPAGSAALRSFVRLQAQRLMPPRRILEAVAENAVPTRTESRRASPAAWSAEERILLNAAAHPAQPADDRLFSSAADDPEALPPVAPTEHLLRLNAAGDHNQAMMELGAVLCLPRAPLCLQCPLSALCKTRSEHSTAPRPRQLSRPLAVLLETRREGAATEVLLERRPAHVSLMPGMYELPAAPPEAFAAAEPLLRLRHAITNTNYAVSVYPGCGGTPALPSQQPAGRHLQWVRTSRLGQLPLTGLARKVLHRLKIMEGPPIELLR